jgi:hypothetical protein
LWGCASTHSGAVGFRGKNPPRFGIIAPELDAGLASRKLTSASPVAASPALGSIAVERRRERSDRPSVTVSRVSLSCRINRK